VSAALVVTTPANVQAPSAPAGLAASNLTATAFTLSWNPSTGSLGIAGYDVYNNGVLVGSTTTTSMGISGLTPATAYSMTVQARDTAGNLSAVSAALTVTTLPTPPSVPTALSATNVARSSFTLIWTASTDALGVANYTIYRNGILIGTSATTSFAVIGLDPFTTYSMTVTATNSGGGVSAASSPLAVTTEGDVTDLHGLCVWLRADLGVTQDGSGNVSAWADQSNIGNNAWVGGAPHLIPDGLNGNPAMYLDGANDCFQFLNVMSGATVGEIFIVAQLQDFSNAYSGLCHFGDSVGTRYAADGTFSDDFGILDGTEYPGPGSTVLTQPHIFNSAVSGNGDSVVRFNGVVSVQRSGWMLFRPNPLVGCDWQNDHFKGYIAEVIVCNQGLTDGERQAVNSYLTTKYAIGLQRAATPSFSPVPGIFTSTQSVSIGSTTTGASIAYTTDGSTPTESAGVVTHGTLYSGVVPVAATTTLKAIAFGSGFADSALGTGVFAINLPGVVSAPTFSPAGGDYTSSQSVIISTATSGASIAYTTDGSTPTEGGGVVSHGTLYIGPVSIDANTTIKTIAFKSGMADSDVATGAFTITILPVASAPTLSPAGGAYATAQSVTISSATSGASIAYTTDGSTPTESGGVVTHGTLYSGAVSISASTTLNAIAFKIGYTDSAVTSGFFTVGVPQAAAPVFNLGDPIAHTIVITSATSGALIRYTTDGTAPTETNGTLYSGPVGVGAATTLRAIAYKGGFTDSPVTSVSLEIPSVSITTPANGSTVP
jgi:chitodextrinase